MWFTSLFRLSLVLLRVLPYWFCSSTAELHFCQFICFSLLAYCQFSFLGHWPIVFFIWMLPTPDWLCQSLLPALDSFWTPLQSLLPTIYVYSSCLCIVSLVSSMQSSIVSSPTLKETAPWETPCTHASLSSSLSLTRNGTLNLIAFIFRTWASFVIITCALSSPLHPKARFDTQY